jgi:uncharacterized repeat protein (TIGR01451 family)
MNSPHTTSGTARAVRRPSGPARAAGWLAAALLSVVGVAAHAQSIDTTTSGNWQGKYGSCGYVLPGMKVFPQTETPVLPGTSSCGPGTCPQGASFPLSAGGNNYGGGATSDLQDCRGQTTSGGFIGNIKYTTRLCQQPPSNYQIGAGYPGAGTLITMPQGFVWNGNTSDTRALQFPTDTIGKASCSPLAQGVSLTPGNRIASTVDDAAEVLRNDVGASGSAAGLCIDLDFSDVPAAQRNVPYKLSAYFVDFDFGSRVHDVRLLDELGNPLAVSTIGPFTNGTYISWPMSTLPTAMRTIQVLRVGTINATLSGLFLDRADSAYCGGPGPAIQVVKKTNGTYAPARDDGLAPVISYPGYVYWTYEVTNTGGTTLSNVYVYDSKIGYATCPKTSLAAIETMVCQLSGPSVNVYADPTSVAGTCPAGGGKLYENGAGASGKAPDGTIVTGNSVGHYCNPATPSITLKKLTNGVDTPLPTSGNAPVLSVGSTVTWTYIVTNTGNIPISTYTVKDDKAGTVCTLTNLAPGIAASCSKTGTVADQSQSTVLGTCNSLINQPMYENTGTVTGTASNGAPVSASYLSHYCNTPNPGSFTITKSPANGTYAIGDNPIFTITVTSTGPGTAKNVVLQDPLPTSGNLDDWTIIQNPGGCSIDSAADKLTCNFGDLAVGQTRTVKVQTTKAGGADASACPGGYTLYNTATVYATGLQPKSATGSFSCTPPPPCKLTIGALTFPTGTAPAGQCQPKQTVAFTITNSGSTDSVLSQITLTWPAANGKLQAVLFGANAVDNVGDVAGTSVTLSGSQLVSNAAYLTIKAGKSVVVTLQFSGNVVADISQYTGTFSFGNYCSVSLNANVCFLGYPYTSSVARTSTVFNESGVLALVDPAVATSATGTVRIFATDEHAPLLGVRTSSKPVSAMPSNPGRVTNPLYGDPTITDPYGRPIFPSLFITDVTDVSDNASHTSAAYRAGDWQYGGTPIPPKDIFGAWKGASKSGTTLTTDADPAKNNLSLGSGADAPSVALTSLGYVAEMRWNVGDLRLNGQPLQAGRTYRLQFIVHDGDQNKTGGDVGQACALVKIQ